MEIASFMPTKKPKIPPEYSVYAYDKYCDNAIGYNKWKCILSDTNANFVYQTAENLFETQQFQKIEIKKKTFHEKKKRYLVSTSHIFKKRANAGKIIFVISFIVALSCFALLMLEGL